MCSLTFPFFTVSVCEPDVVPVSPLDLDGGARSAVATESKCTPWLPTALRAAWYSAGALVVGVAAPAVAGPAAPGPRPWPERPVTAGRPAAGEAGGGHGPLSGAGGGDGARGA